MLGIEDAKTPETRQRRIVRAVGELHEGRTPRADISAAAPMRRRTSPSTWPTSRLLAAYLGAFLLSDLARAGRVEERADAGCPAARRRPLRLRARTPVLHDVLNDGRACCQQT